MKNRLIGLLLALVFAFAFAANAHGDTIKDGTIFYSAGSYLNPEPLSLGVDLYGYNYQAHMFSGSYFNSYANGYGLPVYSGDDADYLSQVPNIASISKGWAWPYRDVQLAMKWNDAWISNKDQDGDGLLDRHFGFPSYIGSGAWLTNHQSGTYTGDDGKEIRWNYFIKVVAAPANAHLVGLPDAGTWYDSAGKEIGPDIWGQFVILQEVENDPGAGAHGLAFRANMAPGFGQY